MADWKELRKRDRAADAEEKIRKILRDLESNEKVVRAIETDDVFVCGKESRHDFVNGKSMSYRGFCINCCDSLIHVEVGVHDKGNKKDIASVRINCSDEAAVAKLKKTEVGEYIIDLTIVDEEGLDVALSLYHGIYLLLKEFKKSLSGKETKND